MKKLFFKILLFGILISGIVLLYILNITDIVTRIMGISTEQQIAQSFTNATKLKYDLLILGSSKFYRGVNPENIKAISSFNFSHDNDAFNQMYYKLKYLKEHNALKCKYAIVGVSYLQFSFLTDSRNYAFNKFFDKEYQKDFEIKKDSLPWYSFKPTENKLSEYVTLNITNTFPYFILGIKSLIIKTPDSEKSYLKENGQYIVKPITKASPNDKKSYDSNILPVQMKYFENILSFAKENKIKLILVNMPMRDLEINSFNDSTVRYFDNLFKSKADNKSVFYVNFGKYTKFTLDDYVDYTHFNPKGADKFSLMLNDSLKKIVEL